MWSKRREQYTRLCHKCGKNILVGEERLVNNKWLVSFGCWTEPKPLSKTGREIGIDRGVKKLFATSKGWKFVNPKYS